MIKKDANPSATFADVWLSHTEKNWDKHWLKKVSEKVNWNKFSYRFEKLYDKDNGRPAWHPIIISASVKTGYVSNLSVCPASEHESKHFLEALAKGFPCL